MSVNWDIVCSVVTSIAAVAALGISVSQIWASNKQQLLDRRLRLWIKAHGLMELCAHSRFRLEKKEDGPELTNDYLFLLMTNNSLLCDIGPVIEHISDQDWKKRFLLKLDELKEMAFEAELVFRGSSAKALGAFFTDYASLLMSIYQYQIMLNCLKEDCRSFLHSLEEAATTVGEKEQRAVLHEAEDKLLNSYDELSFHVAARIKGQCGSSWLS
ncbi:MULTISPECIES: hypothetical protein [Collinsella]|uniref:Uncharacterized protein n=1 Tax=Collinsella ihumii TaxID=1720204 RepID=A0AAW7JRN3_9ACTN|nr:MULTISPECIES: hypothetical protein [Collinsella]MDN0069414.1 hypothetical protein [Collinsella ihumii]